MIKLVGLILAMSATFSASLVLAGEESVYLNSCVSHLWRGAEASSDLRHLKEQERLKRISNYDQDRVFEYFENMAKFVYGKQTLEQATSHPNSIHVPQFLINHFVSVYSDRAQFDQFLMALRRLAELFDLEARDISPGLQLGPNSSMLDTWHNFFTNLASGDTSDRIYLLIFVFYLEVELSNEQTHTLAFMQDQAHDAFKSVFSEYVQVISAQTSMIKQVKSIAISLSQALQTIAKHKSKGGHTKQVDEAVFMGESEFYNALQKVDLESLRTRMVDFELILMPLMNYLSEVIAENPEVGEEMVRRAERTIRQQISVSNENFIVTMAKLPSVNQGSIQFVESLFTFSKFQGLWSFAAIFKNLPNPDQLPDDVKNSIRALFESMEKPQNLP